MIRVFTFFLAIFCSPAFAQDVSIYGGRLLDPDPGDNNHTTIALSGGFDLADRTNILGIDQIRGDFTYARNRFENLVRSESKSNLIDIIFTSDQIGLLKISSATQIFR